MERRRVRYEPELSREQHHEALRWAEEIIDFPNGNPGESVESVIERLSADPIVKKLARAYLDAVARMHADRDAREFVDGLYRPCETIVDGQGPRR